MVEPASITVTSQPAQLQFRLMGDAQSQYAIMGYSCADPDNQLGPAEINKEATQMRVVDSNTKSGTFNINVQMENRTTRQPASVVPITINEPPN